MNAPSFLPAGLNTANARLPQAYESAKAALANCASIDECQEWANKAEALASYAKQADDDSLRKLADRIQARAVRRCGELLKQFDGRGRPEENREGTLPNISQRTAADRAGISEHQRKTAVRVANVPAHDFEAAVESASPPTVSQLAVAGMKSRPVPEGFRAATHVLGTVKDFAKFCAEHDPATVAAGVMPVEIADARRDVATIDTFQTASLRGGRMTLSLHRRPDLRDGSAAGEGVSCTLGASSSAQPRAVGFTGVDRPMAGGRCVLRGAAAAISLRGGEAASRLAHNQKITGASPVPATKLAQTASNSGRASAAPFFYPLGQRRDRNPWTPHPRGAVARTTPINP